MIWQSLKIHVTNTVIKLIHCSRIIQFKNSSTYFYLMCEYHTARQIAIPDRKKISDILIVNWNF